MDKHEFLRLVDSLSRDRGISKDIILGDIEKALVQAANKRFDAKGEFSLTIDRQTGEIRAFEDERPVALESLGRIVANVAKQVIVQKLREGERDNLYEDYVKKQHTIVAGDILRVERGMVIVQMGRAEAILPREEQIRIKLKQGRPIYPVEMKITDDAGEELARDGRVFAGRAGRRLDHSRPADHLGDSRRAVLSHGFAVQAAGLRRVVGFTAHPDRDRAGL